MHNKWSKIMKINKGAKFFANQKMKYESNKYQQICLIYVFKSFGKYFFSIQPSVFYKKRFEEQGEHGFQLFHGVIFQISNNF